MKITLYKGYQSKMAYEAFVDHFTNDDLILYLPPQMHDYSFLSVFPDYELNLLGELWNEKPQIPKRQGLKDINAVSGVFSSGSTAEAKLVLYSRENLQSSCEGIYDLFDKDRIQSLFCFPQPFHTFGLTLGYAASVFLNKSLRFSSGAYSTKHLTDWFESVNEGTLTLGTPTHFYDLLKKQSLDEKANPSYSCIIGGARVEKNLWDQCQSQLCIEQPSIGYGATEASPGLTHLPPGVPPKEDGEIGFPLKHVNIELQAAGLTFSGPNLAHAIIEDQKIEFPKNHFLPDVLSIREDDQKWIYVTRSNWFLNRGGEKFSLEKLESEIHRITGIETVCVNLPDPRLGEDLGILIKTKSTDCHDIFKKAVLETLKQTTLRSFNPEKIRFTKNLPLNRNQKTDRIRAKEFFL